MKTIRTVYEKWLELENLLEDEWSFEGFCEEIKWEPTWSHSKQSCIGQQMRYFYLGWIANN